MLERKSTINDVAKLAGVSKRTVSRVINGASNVGGETRIRIEQAINTLNFSPDKQARGLASSRSYLLGLVYDNPDALYIDQVQRGVLEVCSHKGYELVVHPCQFTSNDFIDDCLRFVRRSNIDGIIVLPPVSESRELAAAMREGNVKYVRLASVDLDDHANLVVSDDRAAMCDMARYLASLGHTNIAYISGPGHYLSSQERLHGFKDTLQELNIPLPDARIVEGKNTYSSGLECAQKLLLSHDRPSAIFANNDEMAAGVLKAAHQLGIQVPLDLSVAGFDDNLLASRIIPSLTTIKRPVAAMAELSAQKIINAIEGKGKQVGADEFLVKPHLIIRESTRSQRKNTP